MQGSLLHPFGGHHQRDRVVSSDDWLTPPDLIDTLGPFDLDPCASVGQPWRTAKVMVSPPRDGLLEGWSGLVWCNPPYSNIGAWMRKSAEHGNGLVMVFGRTETRAFHEWAYPFMSGLFCFAGRLNFHRPGSGERASANAGAPSVIVAYGLEARARLDRIRDRGVVLEVAGG